MVTNQNLQKFLNKIKQSEKGQTLDLSIGEDLSIAIMNLISIEEHLLFTGNKTEETKYFALIKEVRKMRVELLKQIIKDSKGELWCTSKHLLAASMRLFEVGTKHQTKGDTKLAYDFFKKSFDLYNLFWGLNLNLDLGLNQEGNKKQDDIEQLEKPLKIENKTLRSKLGSVVGKIMDCCRE